MRYVQAELSLRGCGQRIMIKFKIDNRDVQAERGTTIMQAAESAGIQIPSMCYLSGLDPSTSCMVCVVDVEGSQALLPSCRAEVEEGMAVETDNERVRSARKTALELLLSEHAGDCIAPCQKACPVNIDIPRMIRKIQKGDFDAAGKIIFEATSGSDIECNMQCEKACRRKQIDESLAICNLINFINKESASRKDKREHPDDSRALKPNLANVNSGFNSIMKKITKEELNVFLDNSSNEGRVRPEKEGFFYSRAEAIKESYRCLHCDCRKQDSCKLRDNADLYQAKQIRFAGKRLCFVQLVFKSYIFEPGKCIKCGICTGISEQKGIKYGFGFLGRGFNTRVGVSFGRYENSELKGIIDFLIENCPTGALAVSEAKKK